MHWKFSGKQDVYLEIAEKYKEYIRMGLLKDGDKMPSVRSAAGEWGVNPNTVARAYALLEEWGYLLSLPKKGVFVRYSEALEEKDRDPEREAHLELIRQLKNRGVDKQISWI